jgi:glucose-6-phosphate 1-dehydrogenase
MQNPLRQGLRIERTAGPCGVVIFGASGDLTRRKLMPALYSLARQNLLPVSFYILGAARTEMDDEGFRKSMHDAIQEHADEGIGDETLWRDFASRIHYVPLDPAIPQATETFKRKIEELETNSDTGKNRLFYLSIPPASFLQFIEMLQSTGLNQSDSGWTRIIVEKPFGRDLESARSLNREILRVFREDQIYRIDHYLGKETVQNIMVLRFANGILEPLWNQRYIDHVQITAAETVGVETRGGYYEQAGALRDMIQNHMMQLLTLVAMEPPAAMDAEAVRDEKTKVLRSIRPVAETDITRFALRAQYNTGAMEGESVTGYRSEPNVNPTSQIETFAVVKFFIDNWRWADVPFYLRSGKRLPRRVTEIAIQYKKVPHLLFPVDGENIQPNFLIMRIQPDEGISIKFGAKLPGQRVRIRQVNMDFQYGTSFGARSPEAYERLLLDAMLGDSTLYSRGDFVELSWQLVMPILNAWQSGSVPLATYPAGSWGPPESDEFIEHHDRRWRRP